MKPYENLDAYMDHAMPRFEAFMQTSLQQITEGKGTLYEAMSYSLEGGGKRFRPLLMFASATLAGGELEETFPAAAALEMIHTYSLIHDDLPAMDDDDLRRGKPTNHKMYGEAAAILAGDSLLTGAFSVLLMNEMAGKAKSFHLARSLADAAGAKGMVAGQIADIEGEERTLAMHELQDVHNKKTGALIEFATEAGARIAGAEAEVVSALGEYARHLGLAYQIHNDLKDIMLDQAESGKIQGHDQELQKNTYPSILGTEGALEALKREREHAQAALESIDFSRFAQLNEKGSELLKELLKYVEF